MDPDELAIRTLVDTWIQASMQADTQTLLDLMTDDVIFTVPGHEPFGKQAFQEAQQSDAQMDATAKIVEVKILGDHAYTRVYLEISMGKARKQGYTLTILRKDDGKWRIARDANMVTDA